MPTPILTPFWRLGDVGTVGTDIHTTPIHSHFWRLGDVGTVPKDIYTEIETLYTTPIHSHFWRLGDVGTVRTDIHTEIGHNILPLYSLIFGDLGTWGQYARIYIRR